MSESFITILADDLTGAAEIAGILRRFGQQPALIHHRHFIRTPLPVQVINTDSRLLQPQHARTRIRQVLSKPTCYGLFFKKIDSLYRGPIGPEIDATLEALSRNTAVVLAHNPSRNRCVDDGLYTVERVPLDQTSFRDDPEYPRWTAEVCQYVESRHPVRVRQPGQSVVDGAINILCASTSDEVQDWAGRINDSMLSVGAADFLTHLLIQRGYQPLVMPPAVFNLPRLIVAGSASAYARSLPEKARLMNIPAVSVTPDPQQAFRQILDLFKNHTRVLLYIGQKVKVDRLLAVRLQQDMSGCVRQILQHLPVAHLCVDGGATAASVIEQMKWKSLIVTEEIFPGVVTLQVNSDIRLTIKPGSYAWPDSVWQS
ncbi:MAG: hypothetical protein KatS3mg104_1630 [Phycisphaerae bacterium]|nr:MAG: hypothetical protein KatS3mg104_1630 [Phycisphaerae bacterium]